MDLQKFKQTYVKVISESADERELKNYIRSIVEEILNEEQEDLEIKEGYTLKKTKLSKQKLSGDPDDYSVDMTVTDTDYEIVNNKTGEVVGVAKVVKNDYFEDGALEIKMNNGATRYVDIWPSEDGNPQTAFNRFIKDPKTSSKYKK